MAAFRLRAHARAILPCAVAVLLALALSAAEAQADTRVPATTYTTDRTWTDAQSPYVLDGDVRVAAGATLTIEPGVVVKFNGQYRQLRVEGRLNARGTAERRVVITSIQDDSVGGDSGGDGPTSGAKGQWRQIYVPASGTVDLSYTTVRYGGYDCCGGPTSYGVVNAYGGKLLIDQTLFIDNQHSAVRISNCTGCSPSATIANSVMTRNGVGVSTLNVGADVRNSRIRANSEFGVAYMLGASYSFAPSTLTDNDITRNGSYGVRFWIEDGVPSSLWPQGQRNNIWANSTGSDTKMELWTYRTRRDIDWTGNYWGDSVRFRNNVGGCESVAPAAAGRLVYGQAAIDGQGPIRSGSYVGRTASGTSVACYYDRIRIEANQFSPTYIPHAGGPAASTEPDYSGDLGRHVPILAFDEEENFYPQEAGAFTDNYVTASGAYILHSDYVNALYDGAGEVLAAAGSPGSDPFPPPLVTGILGDRYFFGPDNQPQSQTSDYIDARGNDEDTYAADSARMYSNGYDDVIYTRAIHDPNDGRLWLQYWIFYYYNSFSVLGAGVHEGDWEFVQVGIGDDGRPSSVTFSAHNAGYGCNWSELDLGGSTGEQPVVYVAARSHANYPRPGETSLYPFVSDRHRGTGIYKILPVESLHGNYRWPTWNGRWGASTSGDFQSPLNPSAQTQRWNEPSSYHAASDKTAC